ncbi:MAG: hypothetical protein RID42_17920 [Alphaproteobacteria bacterium]
MLLNDESVSMGERGFVLREMARFFDHPSSGVTRFDRMNAEWKELVAKVQAGAALSKGSDEVIRAVAAWHQEERDLCLLFSRKIGRSVNLIMRRAHAKDQSERLKDDCESLARDSELKCSIEVPGAAAPIDIAARLGRRNITCSMRLEAPADKKRAVSRVKWLVRQLGEVTDPDAVHIAAHWPGRSPATQATLRAVREDEFKILRDDASVPRAFEVLLVRDLAGKFAGQRTFIEGVEEAVPSFYEQVGQHLRAWVPRPPQLKEPPKMHDPKVDADNPSARLTETAVAHPPSPPHILADEPSIPPWLRRYE